MVVKWIQYGLFLSALLLAACNKPNAPGCLKTRGDNTFVQHHYEQALHFIIKDNFKIHLIQDSLNVITVSAGSNLQSLITVENTNDSIIIDNLNKCNFVRNLSDEIEVEIHFTDLRTLTTYGYGDITNKDTLDLHYFELSCWKTNSKHDLTLQTDSVSFLYHLAGNTLNVSGSSRYAYFYNTGNGWMHAKSLQTERAQIHQDSSGDVEVNASDFLNLNISGSGNIHYNESVLDLFISNQEGSGQMIPY